MMNEAKSGNPCGRSKTMVELAELCQRMTAETNDEKWLALAVEVRLALPSGHREQLQQLINHGPVWDGDVISKAHRGDLVKWGLAARVIVKGEWGYTAATYKGGHVLGEHIERRPGIATTS
jgi:hypothetical protein